MTFIILVTNPPHSTLKACVSWLLTEPNRPALPEFQGQNPNPNSLLPAQCNAVIFVITVWKLTQKFSEINPDMKKLKKAR